MGWANCGVDAKGRGIGYAFDAVCDYPGCEKKIHRGLDYACGGMHGDVEHGCDGYFCWDHKEYVDVGVGRDMDLCTDCAANYRKESGKSR
jgi:hypothetical protein